MKAYRTKLKSALLAGIFLAASTSAQAQSEKEPPQEIQSATIPGWSAFLDGLQDLPSRMIAKLPEDLLADPQVRQELGRLALEALASRTLAAIGDDPAHPVFLPFINETLNVFQPNADTIYRSARIAPGGTYRLEGTRGSLRMTVIGLASDTPDDGGKIRPPVHHDLKELHVDAEDRFEVIISPERPAGHEGDWWQLPQGTNGITLRQVASDWAREKDPILSIERLDVSVERSRRSAEELEKRLASLARNASNSALFLLGIPGRLKSEGYVNKMQVFDVGTSLGGIGGQFYYQGAYEIGDDEALILEAKVPSECLYYSTILTNEVFETTDWVNNHSSLNDSQSVVDPDGMLRIVVSARDPGVPNWLDTAGHDRGVVQGRWTECNAQPIPSLKKVAFDEVRTHLHPDTGEVSPAQREQTIRDRRTAYLKRIRW